VPAGTLIWPVCAQQGEDGAGVSACARVTRLSVTPVKALALHHPDEIVLLRTGAAGDREFFVIDGRDRLISIWKTGRLVRFRAVHDTRSGRITLSSAGDQMCDGPARQGAPVVADFYGRRKVPGTVVEGPWNEMLSDAVGKPVRLVRASDPSAGHDEYPITLLGEDSVAELARRSGAGSAGQFGGSGCSSVLPVFPRTPRTAGGPDDRDRGEPWSAWAARYPAARQRHATPTAAPATSRRCGSSGLTAGCRRTSSAAA
jgi:MOSC N-terminal beta barrel domain